MQINATQIWGEEITRLFNPLWKASTERRSSDEAFGPNPSRALEAAGSAGKNETLHLLSRTEEIGFSVLTPQPPGRLPPRY